MGFYSDAKKWGDKLDVKIYPLVAPADASTFFCVYANTDTQYGYCNFGVTSVSKQYTFTIAAIRYSDVHNAAEKFYNTFYNQPNYRFENCTERYEDGYYIKEFIFIYKETN
jgi:hypothetical protein